tara:strand:- start:1677 stop:4913 length:3237 start_codon:yes stop_codon:yes gene_type:complete
MVNNKPDNVLTTPIDCCDDNMPLLDRLYPVGTLNNMENDPFDKHYDPNKHQGPGSGMAIIGELQRGLFDGLPTHNNLEGKGNKILAICLRVDLDGTSHRAFEATAHGQESRATKAKDLNQNSIAVHKIIAWAPFLFPELPTPCLLGDQQKGFHQGIISMIKQAGGEFTAWPDDNGQLPAPPRPGELVWVGYPNGVINKKDGIYQGKLGTGPILPPKCDPIEKHTKICSDIGCGPPPGDLFEGKNADINFVGKERLAISDCSSMGKFVIYGGRTSNTRIVADWVKSCNQSQLGGGSYVERISGNGDNDGLERNVVGRETIIYFSQHANLNKSPRIIFYFHTKTSAGSFNKDEFGKITKAIKKLEENEENFIFVYPEMPYSEPPVDETLPNSGFIKPFQRRLVSAQGNVKENLMWGVLGDVTDSNFNIFYNNVNHAIIKTWAENGGDYTKKSIKDFKHSFIGTGPGGATVLEHVVTNSLASPGDPLGLSPGTCTFVAAIPDAQDLQYYMNSKFGKSGNCAFKNADDFVVLDSDSQKQFHPEGLNECLKVETDPQNKSDFAHWITRAITWVNPEKAKKPENKKKQPPPKKVNTLPGSPRGYNPFAASTVTAPPYKMSEEQMAKLIQKHEKLFRVNQALNALRTPGVRNDLANPAKHSGMALSILLPTEINPATGDNLTSEQLDAHYTQEEQRLEKVQATLNKEIQHLQAGTGDPTGPQGGSQTPTPSRATPPQSPGGPPVPKPSCSGVTCITDDSPKGSGKFFGRPTTVFSQTPVAIPSIQETRLPSGLKVEDYFKLIHMKIPGPSSLDSKTPGSAGTYRQNITRTMAAAVVIEEFWKTKYPSARIKFTSTHRSHGGASGNHTNCCAFDFLIQLSGQDAAKYTTVTGGPLWQEKPSSSAKGTYLGAWETFFGIQLLVEAGRLPFGGAGIYLNGKRDSGGTLIGATAPSSHKFRAAGASGSNVHYDWRGTGGFNKESGSTKARWVWIDTNGDGKTEGSKSAKYIRDNYPEWHEIFGEYFPNIGGHLGRHYAPKNFDSGAERYWRNAFKIRYGPDASSFTSIVSGEVPNIEQVLSCEWIKNKG